ncbi:MAG: PQQ-dependent sugar dehydrogenase [Planctomycetota bacterium]
MRHATLLCVTGMSLLLAAVARAGDVPLTTIRVASGLSQPLFLGSPPGDLERVFIVEQGGVIKILRAGTVLPTPFLDIHARILAGGERGLLGLAFHPSYASNGQLFVNYTRAGDGATVVARFSVSADPDVADPTSEVVILTIAQPYANHNGGMIAFGPGDGYLYIGMGDGGSGNDPEGRAQDGGVLLGKMLRIDVDGGSPYVSPPDNPFFGPGDPLDEIWALGVRNPWRFSFDRFTHDLYIGDVGQSDREEVDYEPAQSGGENYGWRCMEGGRCTGLTGCSCNDPDLVVPIHEYTHADGCAITGGYVYRGCAVPSLQGTYFFGDYCSARIWSLRWDGTTLSDFRDRTAELDPPGAPSIASITSFGEGCAGRAVRRRPGRRAVQDRARRAGRERQQLRQRLAGHEWHPGPRAERRPRDLRIARADPRQLVRPGHGRDHRRRLAIRLDRHHLRRHPARPAEQLPADHASRAAAPAAAGEGPVRPRAVRSHGVSAGARDGSRGVEGRLVHARVADHHRARGLMGAHRRPVTATWAPAWS